MQKLLQFTAVLYEEGDSIGHLLAWCSLIPHVILVMELTAFLLAESNNRRSRSAMLLSGQFINEAVNLVLKRFIRQPRPNGSGRNDFGMPSSHAQFMGFFAIALLLTLYQSPKSAKSTTPLPAIDQYIWRAAKYLAIITSALTILSRVYLQYHDLRQVLVGFLVGSIMAVYWTRFWKFIIKKFNLKKGLDS